MFLSYNKKRFIFSLKLTLEGHRKTPAAPRPCLGPKIVDSNKGPGDCKIKEKPGVRYKNFNRDFCR
jgi:hypothetical protein